MSLEYLFIFEVGEERMRVSTIDINFAEHVKRCTLSCGKCFDFCVRTRFLREPSFSKHYRQEL